MPGSQLLLERAQRAPGSRGRSTPASSKPRLDPCLRHLSNLDTRIDDRSWTLEIHDSLGEVSLMQWGNLLSPCIHVLLDCEHRVVVSQRRGLLDVLGVRMESPSYPVVLPGCEP